ncbi:hypothetical protein YB2330_004641 [Saitoella coloradoensis]
MPPSADPSSNMNYTHPHQSRQPPSNPLLRPTSIDAPPTPLRIICIGAGISGIITAIRFPQHLNNMSLTLLEKNSDVGGTWHENRYAGCQCDIPAHSYQMTFEPNVGWSKFYAPASEIGEYYRRMARKYGVYKYCRFNTIVTSAVWNSAKSKWVVSTENLRNGEKAEEECDILIGAMGSLNNWKWPTIPGLDSFAGKLLHSALWDESYDFSNKRIAVIGSGSSAIQIVPALSSLPGVQLSTFVRGKTWISLPFAGEEAVRRNPTGQNYEFTKEEREKFIKNPEYYHAFRKDLERELNLAHAVTFSKSAMQMEARGLFEKHMRNKLASKPEIADKLLPEFAVACRRLTPGPGYLEALASSNVEFVTDEIEKITEDGIVTKDGVARNFDVLICATGFDTSFKPRFPFIGSETQNLQDRWAEPENHANAYLSVAVDNIPNYWSYLGPNSAVGSGSLTIVLERQGDYIIECIKKMQRERVSSMVVKPSAAAGWSAYVDEYFRTTVYGEKCRTWYKAGREEGRVVALWPGSCLHAVKALEHPRWEDYDYSYHPVDGRDVPHKWADWLGDGWTHAERLEGDTAWYLDSIDYPPVDAAWLKSEEAQNEIMKRQRILGGGNAGDEEEHDEIKLNGFGVPHVEHFEKGKGPVRHGERVKVEA